MSNEKEPTGLKKKIRFGQFIVLLCFFFAVYSLFRLKYISSWFPLLQ